MKLEIDITYIKDLNYSTNYVVSLDIHSLITYKHLFINMITLFPR